MGKKNDLLPRGYPREFGKPLTRSTVKEIRTYSCPDCFLCGTQGEMLYRDLKDCLFFSSGKWNFKRCPNSECGLIWLDPMPIRDDIGKAYQTYYTHKTVFIPDTLARRLYSVVRKSYLAFKYGYDGQSYSGFQKALALLTYFLPCRRAEFDYSVMHLSHQSGRRLLEIGCGNGEKLRVLEELGWCVEGIDFDPAAVENARGQGLRVNLGTLEEQRYQEKDFDAVTMSHLIEHVDSPIQTLQECYRILKDRGQMVVITPNSGSLSHKIYGQNWRGLEPPRHLHIFTPLSLRSLATRAGFTKVQILTSVRGARWMFVSSWSILQMNRGKNAEHKKWIFFLLAEIMQILELLSLKVTPGLGEEIIMIANK